MKRNKYGVSPKADRTVDGIVFASKREATRYRELRLLEKCGDISKLELQPRFLLQAAFDKNGKHYRPIHYVADFRYTIPGYRPVLDRCVVEDSKGKRTDVYLLKQKWFEAKYPDLTIVEV